MVQIGMVFIGNKIQQKEQIHSRPLLIQHHLLQLKLLNGYLLYQVKKDHNFAPEKLAHSTKKNKIFKSSRFFRRIDTSGESILSGSRYFRRVANFGKSIFSGNRYFRGVNQYLSLFMGRDTLSWRWILCL